LGAWGVGLYSNDFALDLRSTIAALVRLPFDARKILEILCETERHVAQDPQDADHTTFWFVTADQFQKRGLHCPETAGRALALIDSGSDEVMHQKLGMSANGLRKRSANLAKLRERLQCEAMPTRRKTLKRPQELIMAVGDIFAYPTSRGVSFNPYFHPSDRRYTWAQDAWGAMLVVDAGLAFGYLAWYRVMVAKYEFDNRPTVAMLARAPWTLRDAGTCSLTHFRRMALELISKVVVNTEKLESAFGKLGTGDAAAVSDISIGNHTGVVSKNPDTLRFVQPSMERAHSLDLQEFTTESLH
jgi:hypothetical protein